MFEIYYSTILILISILWCMVRIISALKSKKVNWKRELQLLLVYICIIVVARFTFFPFSKVNGKVQPLLWDWNAILPFRINWIPFVHLLDYPSRRDILLNLIGNTTMFIPIGIVFPIVYTKLNTLAKAISAGFGFSLCIEIIQLLFQDRVSDVDDLLLNTLGYILGYLIYAAVTKTTRPTKYNN